MESIKLPSKYQVGDEITLYIPGEQLRIKDELSDPEDVVMEGIVIGVHFTRSRILYDILDNYNEVFKDMDSTLCIEPSKDFAKA